MLELNLNEEQASSYYLAALILFTGSRFVCTWLMKFISPARLLTILSAFAVILTAGVIFGTGYTGVYSLVGISGCMSLMFPTIYGLGLYGLGEDTKVGGSGLIMAILGGAVITAIQGQVSDVTGSIHLAYLVPLSCFILIGVYGVVAHRKEVASYS